MHRWIVVLSATLLVAASSLPAGEFLPPYDGIQAGLDAHAVGEARRLDAINRQLGWNQLFRWQAATQTSSSIFYDPYIPGFDYAYRLGGAGYGGWSPNALDFRPIWGYGYFEAVRQPIGQRQVQTGPNRWESHPIYAEDLTPRVVQPVAPAPPAIVAEPAPREPTAPAPRGREF
jgi:hypothetical protein